MSSNPAHSTPANQDGKIAAQVISLAMVIGGLAGVYFGWHFTATWSTSANGNILGTGWILEAAFWTLRAIPGIVLFGLLAVLGAFALHGMAVPKKPKPPVARDDEGPGPDSADEGSGLHFG